MLREVCMEYEPATRVGDFVLVHVGFAISILDREEAARTWALLEAMDQLEELDAEDP
ncbi:MAG: HypC/HybG/HupF family hydrogenase formation chaperone [Sandaracinaceae bacterium]|nr:HypC/HybG/HupF family hydrogenase formation chaperone [Sandaracinaceae bacterium]